ncbi:UDP-N-acetylmuramoyl-L-alanyl-D-glutamate--2,6-diaminopimelate ligase [Tepidimonas charontis]|uniref:UDP-N-acetylmuramoyl-L-alanyl-D-glutamate--2,6-diaminopimelate ligase n=1 Tax=Tepidimonas charontis TaxID=2267262 RepID=A0A554XIT6_9BURK|nr:UDP-N-acetylmuramoyl-L-alanyl-D-glutamate--2,6-diaminopimelate ligase [Tepidimonas charontis]TSE35735.1 UDP-N-acetylmuramoyl-L-alanyl-D-glutamate--2,6-diaminopimelate ligase [Tepidimonas charontis]
MSALGRSLDDLASIVAWLRARGARGLSADSRRLPPGHAFIAWPGAATDARRFVCAALQAGAPAAVVEAEGLPAWLAAHPQDAFDVVGTGTPEAAVRAVAGLRRLAGPLASAFWDHPSRALDLIAITGTNGKTSTAWWVAQWLQAAGRPAGLIGTLGVGHPGQALAPTGLTTPDPVMLQGALRGFADAGVRAVALEASSIGLAEGRLEGAAVHTAVFTNLTQDHLDYHGSMDAYWAAKRRLFDWPGLRVAVVCLDDTHGRLLAQALSQRGTGVDLWTYATTPEQAATARLRLLRRTWREDGVCFTVAEGGREASFTLPVVGDYNLANLLAAIAVLRSQGLPWPTIQGASAALTAVPGRMQPAWDEAAASDAGLPLVLVDYAHTPDAVAQALRALRPLAQRRAGRLWCLLGCGGDRDPSKRPLMAAAAEAGADAVVLTSDNPRSEDPLAILAQMQRGLRAPGKAHVEVDRARAIDWVVYQAAPADVVLLAGKGHEDYQEVGGVRRPFSDVAQARAALQRRREESR